MSDQHQLVVHLRLHDPAGYMGLAVDVRRAVETALLARVEAVISLAKQAQWQDPANLDIQPQTVNGVTSFTLAAIQELLSTEAAGLGQDYGVDEALTVGCRYCGDYHCDGVRQELTFEDEPWVVYGDTPTSPSQRFYATVGLEFVFPSGG